jgi:signal transduction histidine kinase
VPPPGDGGGLRCLYAEGVTRQRWVLDAGIAAGVFLLTVGLLAVRGFGVPGPDAHGLDAIGVVLALLSAAPLAVRRRAPLPVYAITSGAGVAMISLHFPLDVPFGVLVSAYAVAVAYSGHPQLRRRRTAWVVESAFVPAVAVAYAVRGGPVAEVAPPLTAWALVFLGVWIAADRNRLRQERMIALADRVRRAEAEAERDRRLVAAEERTRIARELHDSAGHAINVILVQAGAARLLQDQQPARAREAIMTVETVARETLTEIDRLVRVLRSDDVEDSPTLTDPAAIDELVDQHRSAGLAVAAQLYGSRDGLPRSVAWATYRILQEALTNAARHGSGSADMSVFFGPDDLQITVTNPLTPAPPTPAPRQDCAGGHGIVGMRERAHLLGGSLQAGSYRGHFRLHARLPLREAAR